VSWRQRKLKKRNWYTEGEEKESCRYERKKSAMVEERKVLAESKKTHNARQRGFRRGCAAPINEGLEVETLKNNWSRTGFTESARLQKEERTYPEKEGEELRWWWQRKRRKLTFVAVGNLDFELTFRGQKPKSRRARRKLFGCDKKLQQSPKPFNQAGIEWSIDEKSSRSTTKRNALMRGWWSRAQNKKWGVGSGSTVDGDGEVLA